MCSYLVKMLDRSNVELLTLAATFLKKLSIIREHKDRMARCVVPPRSPPAAAAGGRVFEGICKKPNP